MKNIFGFIKKNAARVIGTVAGLPVAGAGVGASGEAGVDTLEGALIGLVIAIIAVVKQYRNSKKGGIV